MTYYRTREPNTLKILGNWVKDERLAFDRVKAEPLEQLEAALPAKTKDQFGDFKPTDPVFRKMSAGFNKVSDIWIELGRFIGVWDFSVEQAIFGAVAVMLDKENVRVKLDQVVDGCSRANSIQVFCLNEPDYQGVIKYDRDRLTFPDAIFKAFIERRLNVYKLNCDFLEDVLTIPDYLDRGEDEEGEEDPELEAERTADFKRDQFLEEAAEEREAARMAEVYSGDDSAL